MKNASLKGNTGLLVLLLGVIALVASYLLGFTSYNDKNSELSANIDSLETRRDELKADYAKKDEYEKQAKEYDSKYEEILGEFDTGLSNESQIMDLYNMQTKRNVLVTTATLADPEETYAFDGSLTTAEMTAQTQTTDANGNVIESDPIITSTAIDSSYRGVSCDESFTMEGTYADVKEALKDIVDGSKRRVPTTISFTYDSTTEIISCTATISEYAITGDDRKQNKVDIPSTATGRDNIFLNGLGAQVPTAAQ